MNTCCMLNSNITSKTNHPHPHISTVIEHKACMFISEAVPVQLFFFFCTVVIWVNRDSAIYVANGTIDHKCFLNKHLHGMRVRVADKTFGK